MAVHLENGIEAVLSILGALRAGAVFVPINPTTKGSKLGYLLADSRASLLVSDRRSAQAVAEARDIAGPSTTVVMTGVENGRALTGVSFPFVRFEDMASAATDLALPRRIDLDLAALIYTSGSTGRPKGVMMTHANILAATTSINGYLQQRGRRHDSRRAAALVRLRALSAVPGHAGWRAAFCWSGRLRSRP